MTSQLDGPSSAPVAVRVWRRLDRVGIEHCRVWADASGATLAGSLTVVIEDRHVRVAYTVHCSAAWDTRRVEVQLTDGPDERALTLVVDAEHRWWQDGRELAELAGCVDVDLGVTPSTNTLPIRRLGLAVGARQAVTAAWVGFPKLTVEPLAQTYERTAADVYRYVSGGGAFAAELTVDAFGPVERYGALWDLVERTPAGP